MILAIDPGNMESGYVYLKDDLSVVKKGKIDNEKLLQMIKSEEFIECENIAIEMVASYGMAVGATVFETCVWIGRFIEALNVVILNQEIKLKYIYRKDEKINLCHTMRAKDSNIIQALVDRFAPNTKNRGKGTSKEPGWFYGFKKDIWQAYAVAVTYHDLYMEG